MDKFELQKLRDLPIEGVAERLGMDVTRHKALCPFHDDHHASLSFSVRRNTFRCFVCGEHGNTIDLVMRRLGKNFREATEWLGASPQPSPKGKGDRKPSASLPISPPFRVSAPRETRGFEGSGQGVGSFDASRYERYFEHPWLNDEARRFLFDERRLDPRVVSWCRLTSWRDRHGVPWLQIPYYNSEGRLVGVQNRNLVKGGSPRFRFPQGSECGIYNLPVLGMLKPHDELWITEGCSDCWAMLSSGRKAIAIPSATLLSALTRTKTPQLSIFNLQFSITYHMYPDRDVPGERLFLQLKQLLPTLQHHQLPPDCKDFGEYYVKYCRS